MYVYIYICIYIYVYIYIYIYIQNHNLGYVMLKSSSSLPSVERRRLPFEQVTTISSQSPMHMVVCLFVCLFVWRDSPHWAMASSFTRFLDHTQRRITVGRTPLDE